MMHKSTYNFLKTTLFFTLLILLSSLYYFHLFYKENASHSRILGFGQSYFPYNETDNAFFIYTPGCRIPKIDPFDLTVRRFYSKTPAEYKCGPKEPLFHVREKGIVELNETLLYQQQNVHLNQTHCYYHPITRKVSGKKPDDTFLLTKEHPMVFNIPLDDDAILLKCKTGNKTIVSNVLPLTPHKPEVEERCRKASETLDKRRDKLNIIIVGIDSISKLNFLRYFTKTLHVLRNQLSAIELNGFTKVADNTYPNLIPLLTGRHRNNYKAFEKRFGFYDSVDFVWKRYSKLGYRTLFSEDAPNMGTFVMHRRGFKKPPTDYYTRPFSVAAETLNMRRKNHCIGPTLEMRVYFDYLKNFVSSFIDKPIFTFTFVARLTHDVLKYAGFADKPSYDLITNLKESGVFNTSLFVFFSDHGIRFGDIRQTYIGKIEERMPFIFLAFPDWFLKNNPEYHRSLELNKNRLTTPYDIHATLLHLLEPDKKDFFTIHGQSLLTEISPERTCAHANIAKHWCVCQVRHQISTQDPTVRKAASAIVKQVNKLLRPHVRSCAPLKMAKILDARVSHSNEDFLDIVVKDYLITLIVVPSNAVFEATVQLKGKRMTVSEEVSRINMYGDESVCIDDAVMKKYCYCKIHLNHS